MSKSVFLSLAQYRWCSLPMILPVCWMTWHPRPTNDAHFTFYHAINVRHYFFVAGCATIVEITTSCGIWLKLRLRFFSKVSSCDAILYICSTSALTTYQSHFAKYGSRWKEHERFAIISRQRTTMDRKLALSLWKWENTGKTLSVNVFAIVVCRNLECVTFHFDFKFMSNAFKFICFFRFFFFAGKLNWYLWLTFYECHRKLRTTPETYL